MVKLLQEAKLVIGLAVIFSNRVTRNIIPPIMNHPSAVLPFV